MPRCRHDDNCHSIAFVPPIHIVSVRTMSITTNPEAQDALFEKKATEHHDLPPNLSTAAFRLNFPPSYVFVGVYRLSTERTLYGPVWDNCTHDTRREAIVGSIWAYFRFFQTMSHDGLTMASMHTIGIIHFGYSKEIYRTISIQVIL